MLPYFIKFKFPPEVVKTLSLNGPFLKIFILILLSIGITLSILALTDEKKYPTAKKILSAIIIILVAIATSIVLVNFKEINIRTYGVMLSVGFITATAVAARTAQREGIPPDKIFDLAFWILLATLLGGRTLYLLVSKEPLNLSNLISFWQGGLVFYGGFIASLIAGYFYISINKLNFWQIADIVAPSIALGHAFGRFGCFSAGCCYGKITSSSFPLAAVFTEGLAPLHVPLHPTQLYESFFNILLFFFLTIRRKNRKFFGEIISLYLILYAIIRFFIEFWRGDKVRGLILQIDLIPQLPGPELLSTSQIISIITAVGGTFLYLYLQKKLRYK